MSKTQSSLTRTIARRDFLRGSAAIIAGVSGLKSLPALGKQQISPNTVYSSVIKEINKMLPVAMGLKDITGASNAAHNAPDLASRVIEWMLAAKLGMVPKNKTLSLPDIPIASLDESALRRCEGVLLYALLAWTMPPPRNFNLEDFRMQ